VPGSLIDAAAPAVAIGSKGRRSTSALSPKTDAELVTLCVAQVLMGIPSERRVLPAARRQPGHLFPCLPTQDALHKRRVHPAETSEWSVGVFAEPSPVSSDDLVLLDSTPVERGRSLETSRRSALAEICGDRCSKSHSRWCWGMRCTWPALPTVRPARRNEPEHHGMHLAPVVSASSRSFTRARACARPCATERARRAPCSRGSRLVCSPPAACIRLDHELGRPRRAIVDYTA